MFDHMFQYLAVCDLIRLHITLVQLTLLTSRTQRMHSCFPVGHHFTTQHLDNSCNTQTVLCVIHYFQVLAAETALAQPAPPAAGPLEWTPSPVCRVASATPPQSLPPALTNAILSMPALRERSTPRSSRCLRLWSSVSANQVGVLCACSWLAVWALWVHC